MEESKRKWKKKEFRRQTSLGRCRGVRGTRPSLSPLRCFFLWNREILAGKTWRGIKERTNIERDGSAYKALLRLVFISSRASVECGRKRPRNERSWDERRGGEGGRVRRKRAAGKVQKCIPLHAEQECKNIATGFPASRFTLDDRVDELEQWQFWTFWLDSW